MTLLQEVHSRGEINEIVDRRIRATTRLAYDHNEFMHGLFKKAEMNPHHDINGRQDLLKATRKGVRTKAEDISQCYADYIDKIQTFEVWSSGSSGKSKKMLRSPDEMARIGRGQVRVYRSAGVQDGQHFLAFPAAPPYGSSLSTLYGLKDMNVRSLIFLIPPVIRYLSDEEKAGLAKNFNDMLLEFNPDFVRGGTWQVSWLPRFLQPYGFDPNKLCVKAVLFAGDPTSIEDRKKIGSYWNAEPLEIYSSTETSIISYECNAHIGMHLNELDVFTSAIDPETGEEVALGEKGIDIVTPLFEENELPATMIINYSHGDHIRMLSEKCTCTREFALMDHPTRDTRKRPIRGLDFDPRVRNSLLKRAARKAGRMLE